LLKNALVAALYSSMHWFVKIISSSNTIADSASNQYLIWNVSARVEQGDPDRNTANRLLNLASEILYLECELQVFVIIIRLLFLYSRYCADTDVK